MVWEGVKDGIVKVGLTPVCDFQVAVCRLALVVDESRGFVPFDYAEEFDL